MEDEQQLASLVLLLRLSTTAPPQNTNDPDDVTSSSSKVSSAVEDVSTPPPSPLQKSLEENDCNLLLFIGRLVNAYNNSLTSNNAKCSTKIPTTYALLRLAIHVIFLRYTEETAGINYHNNRVVECEQHLLHKLLPATLHARASLEIEEVDVEIAWVMRGIVLRHSQQQVSVILDGKQTKKKSLGGDELLWVDFMETLVNRRMLCRGEGATFSPLQNATTANATDDNDDDDEAKLMVQTIHSILDGGIRSTPVGDTPNSNSEIKNSDNNGSDWNLEFNKTLVGCIQSFLQHADADAGGDFFRLKGSTIFGLIQFSQQSDAMSVHVYVLVLQYLQLCMQSSNSLVSSLKNCFIGVNGNQSEEAVTASIRSFVFYGMVVLGNTVSSLSNNQRESNAQEAALSTNSDISLKGLRGTIYTLAMDLWRSFGPDWLFYDSNTRSSSILSNEFWWFRSKNTENQLGLTWPLCTLVQLAAGDFRLNLGRWVTIVEDGNVSSQDNEFVCSEIESCATAILETVQLMTSLADDGEGVIASGVWVPEALLHIRKSLEDALNSSVQYLNSFSCGQDETPIAVSDQANNVGRICCVLVGTIASELEVEDLLISPSIDERNMELTKEAEASCFATALAAGMLLCNAMGEKNVTNAERLETSEPLCCLLPCIMSVVACSNSNKNVQTAVSSLDRPLVYVMSRFLHRAGERWKHLDRRSQTDEAFTILSITGLCLLIIEEMVTSSASRVGYQELTSPLIVWREALLEEEDEVEDALKEHVDTTLQQVGNCLIILKTYQ
eukprot:CAMPEP_0113399162 /NCGR_PEP_ID=MMETSP0013_2-20120614/15379_1 /TAXON_ID=2843 ORGANISM="Skeletonema costatum, Strain 1716" /NCGR_SAMPLE_ID=MMETSP0013_2 /ASSEMBLY_ACC=CAM_ASM_000158 /LENGTH=781 /DNA_ID=CAMNT_0000284019 /DNA_START=6 /DNA_END=2351 /DNA_ORIENTATION=- /assembly_acc=CAM_ASM_000158